jgi:hypothetical protein
MKKLTVFLLLFAAFTLPVVGQDSTATAKRTVVGISNASSTGTTVNRLAKLTGAPARAVIAGTSDTDGVIGIVTSGAGTSGVATIQTGGLVRCDFDGATVSADYVSISSVTAGKCHSAGSTYPTSGQVLGRVLSTNVGAGAYDLILVAGVKAASGASLPVDDATAVVKGSSDATKLFRIEADTNIPTGTTVVGTPPASSFTFAGINLAQTFSAAQTFSGQILAANGSAAAPAFAFSTQPGTGLYKRADNFFTVSIGGSAKAEFSVNRFQLDGSNTLGWGNGAVDAVGADTGIARADTALVKLTDSSTGGGGLQLPPKAATPTDPSSSSEGNIYIKGGKLVIQYNDGGTVRYKYLDLTGTGVTWTHTTSAP